MSNLSERDFFVDPVGDIFLGLADGFGLLWPGDFEARLNYTCGGDFHYMSERFSRALHILAEPPEEAVGLVLPVIDYSQASVIGKPLQNHEIILFPPGSELDFVSMGNAGCESFFLPETLFESILESLYPGTKLLQHGSTKPTCSHAATSDA